MHVKRWTSKEHKRSGHKARKKMKHVKKGRHVRRKGTKAHNLAHSIIICTLKNVEPSFITMGTISVQNQR